MRLCPKMKQKQPDRRERTSQQLTKQRRTAKDLMSDGFISWSVLNLLEFSHVLATTKLHKRRHPPAVPKGFGSLLEWPVISDCWIDHPIYGIDMFLWRPLFNEEHVFWWKFSSLLVYILVHLSHQRTSVLSAMGVVLPPSTRAFPQDSARLQNHQDLGFMILYHTLSGKLYLFQYIFQDIS